MDFGNIFHFEWETVPFRLIAFVIAFSLHEWAHAFVAWRLGDNTAKQEGRLTINPIPHIDPFGLILILFGPFGWAKPVPVNPSRFRGNRRLGMVYVSAAGPLINLVLAFLFAIAYIYSYRSGIFVEPMDKYTLALKYTLEFSIGINCGLFVFNLLPINPLDGNKILRYLTPRSMDGFFHKLDLYGPWLLLLLVFIPGLSIFLLLPIKWVVDGVMQTALLFM
ncbi:site-2 protease family protein [Brevibacillus sp. SYSU BS000544]|uniref:site-2 protease family protein n=1 Tax=Brevibacillus sp. SYSU BS000544 TaxID=3416443 RepID=UPI003CE56843